MEKARVWNRVPAVKKRDFDACETRMKGIAEKKRLLASGVAEVKIGPWRGKRCWIFYLRGAPFVRLSESDLKELRISMQDRA
jgi:hypothetical protein